MNGREVGIRRLPRSVRTVLDLVLVTGFAVAAVLFAGRGITAGFVGAGIGMLAAETVDQLCGQRAVKFYASVLARNARLRSRASSALF